MNWQSFFLWPTQPEPNLQEQDPIASPTAVTHNMQMERGRGRGRAQSQKRKPGNTSRGEKSPPENHLTTPPPPKKTHEQNRKKYQRSKKGGQEEGKNGSGAWHETGGRVECKPLKWAAGSLAMTPAGLEPAIPGSVGRCLIHWATGPVMAFGAERDNRNTGRTFAIGKRRMAACQPRSQAQAHP